MPIKKIKLKRLFRKLMKSDLIILIAHYNNPKGLEESLMSIRESFSIDIMIVDDGSKVKFDEDHIKSIYLNGKIYFEYLENNSGVGVAANKGLDQIQKLNYKLIGRLDCGDLCYENKYKKQLDYLEKNPDIKILGTWARFVDEKGNFLHNLIHPTEHEDIKNKMFLNSMFCNPTMVFYSEILEKTGKYPFKYRHAAQDYAFFFNAIQHYKAENYPEILMDYIVDPKSISTTKRKLQVKNRIKIVLEHFYFGFYPIYGLIRGVLLYMFPRSVTTYLKKILKH